MPGIIALIKIVALVQLAIIIVLLLLSYGIKIYSHYKSARNARLLVKLEQILLEGVNHTERFDPKLILHYKREIVILLTIINKFDASIKKMEWQIIRQLIIDLVVLPKARVLAQKRSWIKRYLACQAFKLSLEKQDERFIEMLISDSIPLVAINAAMLAINYNAPLLIDKMIDVFSQGRRLQQSLYDQALTHATATIIPLIKERLAREKNPYVKAFCYRSLSYVPFVSEPIETIQVDLGSDNLDLKLAVLDYLHHNAPQSSEALFLPLLKDSHWEVRARAAKLLGELGDDKLALSLEECLKDPAWWVRINAAESLFKLGKKGIALLKKQKPSIDQYAYDVAAQVLSTKTMAINE